ncbi:MAG: Lrp/AsnC family transcriptional regulator [Pseudomonadota bacterium]
MPVSDTYPKLDETDRRILRALQADGRLTIQDLSDQVGLSPSPVSRRVRLLEERGILTGYAALIDEAKLGFGVSVFVSVQLDKQIDQALAKFEAAIAGFPEVVDCWLMTGNRDYLLRVATADLAEFEAFLTGRLTRVAGVSNIESSIPLRRVKAGTGRTA